MWWGGVWLVSLMVKLQRKPEYQSTVSFLLDKVRSVQQKGGLHAERMERQLTGRTTRSSTGDASQTHSSLVLSQDGGVG